MNHEIYIFGSLARGELSATSDVDVLVIPLDSQSKECYSTNWSIYSPETIESYYRLGRLFAWHLHLEGKCIFTPNGEGLLAELGSPAPYTTYVEDINDLATILNDALNAIRNGSNSMIFELGVVHTALRDIAMSASWRLVGRPNFSRDAPFNLPVSFPVSRQVYNIAMLARHSSTRGIPVDINIAAVTREILSAPITEWINDIRSRV